MDQILFAIILISGISFVISLAICILTAFTSHKAEHRPAVFTGAIFVIAIWKYCLVLAIIGIVLTLLSFIFNIIMLVESD